MITAISRVFAALTLLCALGVLATPASANTNITTCGPINLNADTDFYLQNNVTAASSQPCFTVSGTGYATLHAGYYSISESGAGAVSISTSGGGSLTIQNAYFYGSVGVNCGSGSFTFVSNHNTYNVGSSGSGGLSTQYCSGPSNTYDTYVNANVYLIHDRYAYAVHNSISFPNSGYGTGAGIYVSDDYQSEVGYNTIDDSTYHQSDDGVLVTGSTGTSVHNNTVSGFYDCSIELAASNSYVTVDSNTVSGATLASIGCFYNTLGICDIDHITISNNSLDKNLLISGHNSTGALTNITVTGNTVGSGLSYFGYNSPLDFAGVSITFTGNDFGSSGLAMQSSTVFGGITDGGGNYCGSVYPAHVLTCH